MKLCPHCKTELDDNARFCLSCMTALDEKEQIPPPVRQIRRWPLLLLGGLVLSVLLVLAFYPKTTPPTPAPALAIPEETTPQTEETPHTQTVDGVQYIFRPATREDHPTAIRLDGYYVLVRVEGRSPDGVYQVPSFVGNDTNALVTVIADGAFDGTDAKEIDLGHNVRYVWGDAFGGYALTDLYLHTDVLIDRQAFSGCGDDLTIHCPDYLGNTEGALWADLAIDYGFRWKSEII